MNIEINFHKKVEVWEYSKFEIFNPNLSGVFDKNKLSFSETKIKKITIQGQQEAEFIYVRCLWFLTFISTGFRDC